MSNFQEPPAEKQTAYRDTVRRFVGTAWKRFNEPETFLGFHRDNVRRAILEMKTIFEIMALSAATTAAGLLTKSEILKNGGVVISLTAMVYFNMLFPNTISQPGKPHYHLKNICYLAAKILCMAAFVYLFIEWIGRLTESGLGLVLGETLPTSDLE